MAIFINGEKIAGRGPAGASAYDTAVKNGFTGTEFDFNANLGEIGDIITIAQDAATRAEAANQAAQAVKNNLTNYPTKSEVTASINQSIASIDTGVWSYGPEAPSNTNLLWIDSSLTDGGLKFYVNGAWTHVPVAWQ